MTLNVTRLPKSPCGNFERNEVLENLSHSHHSSRPRAPFSSQCQWSYHMFCFFCHMMLQYPTSSCPKATMAAHSILKQPSAYWARLCSYNRHWYRPSSYNWYRRIINRVLLHCATTITVSSTAPPPLISGTHGCHSNGDSSRGRGMGEITVCSLYFLR